MAPLSAAANSRVALIEPGSLRGNSDSRLPVCPALLPQVVGSVRQGHRPDVATPAVRIAGVLAAEDPELVLVDDGPRCPRPPRGMFHLPDPGRAVGRIPDVVQRICGFSFVSPVHPQLVPEDGGAKGVPRHPARLW